MMRPLEVVGAGAGSGKTHLIMRTLRERVEAGLVRPERIVAVTFTEAAAAELRERIRATLVEAGRLEDALRLDRAYISTIHGFGLRLLVEHAYEGGLPPRPRLLDSNEEAALIRTAIAGSGDVEVLTTELSRYGYSWDPATSTSAEDQFRGMVLAAIGKLRSIGRLKSGAELAAWARSRLRGGYGPTCDGEAATAALHSAVVAMLAAFPEDVSGGYVGNASAVRAFRQDHRNLVAASDALRLRTDWGLWQGLRKLRKSARGAATPPGYDALADAVILAADELPHHPGPLADAERHAEALILAADQAVDAYAEGKRKSALVDYSDMIAGAFDLLRLNPDALSSLKDRVDCLVVDEFQDTNPLQHALLWLMRDAGVPTMVVGDLKQAIMGFQGADPRLMGALLADPDAAAEPLKLNWRTQPSLMPFVNAVGRSLFGEAYVDLDPQAPEGAQPPLEVVEHPKPAKGGSKPAVRAARTAERIAALLRSGKEFVRDRHIGEVRPLRPGDVAVLHPKHKGLAQYADALRSFGLRARITEDGWLSSRAVEIACHALEYAADPSDRHAALYLACTELGSHTPESACRRLDADGRIPDPALERLDAVGGEADGRTVDRLLADVLTALDLYGVVSEWPEAAQLRADLLRLEGEAASFVAAKPESLAGGGHYGSGVKTFLAWLADRVTLKDGDRRPAVGDEGGDAVELATWHGSKGREWPVVFVCGWDSDVKARLPDLTVEYDGFDDLSGLLPKARLSFTPPFAAPETEAGYLERPLADARETARRLIYVAMTRARERLVVEWHSHLSGSKRETLHSLFSDAASARLLPDAIELGGRKWPCIVTSNDGSPPAVDMVEAAEALPVVGRRAIDPRPAPASAGELFAMPSTASAARGACPDSEVDAYGDPLRLDLELKGAAYGTLVHRCFEVLGHDPSLGARLADAVGHALTAGQAVVLAEGAARFEAWLRRRFDPVRIEREWPFVAVDGDGTVWSGSIDCLVGTRDGWWIVDHKTEAGEAETAVARHWPQLAGYVSALRAMGMQVAGVAVNLPNEGKAALARVPASVGTEAA